MPVVPAVFAHCGPTVPDVLLAAGHAGVGPLVGVETFVQAQMHVLRELGAAHVAGVRLLSVVQPKVRLQVGSGGESLVADVAAVRTFTWKDVDS